MTRETAEARRERLRWTPIRSGRVYCSPACGRGCTFAAFKRATKNANALVTRLGEGWEARVWENLGWHYSVKRGVAEMHVTGHERAVSYTLYFNSTVRQLVVRGRTPEQTIKHLRAQFKALKRELEYMLATTDVP